VFLIPKQYSPDPDDSAFGPYVDPQISDRAKRLTLRVDPKNRRIKLVIPRYAREKDVKRFVERHQAWIAARLADLPRGVPFDHGRIIPIFGRERKIHIEPSQKRTTECVLSADSLLVHSARPDPSSNIRRWLIEQLRRKIEPLSHDKAAAIGKSINGITLRDTGTRWGSCTSNGKLSYSWRLVFCPDHVIDYLAAHEVAHLQHMDHSKAFWTLCDSLSDNMIGGREYLKLYGTELMRYGNAD